MPHTIRNAFDKHLTVEALLNAHDRASKTKRYSREVLKFEIDLETNIVNLYKKLKMVLIKWESIGLLKYMNLKKGLLGLCLM